MRMTRALMLGTCGTLLTVLALTQAAAQPPQPPAGDEALFPGARRLAKFKLGFAHQPILVSTADGPRLAVWAHQRDPNSPTDPMVPPKGKRPARPNPVDLIVWDAASGKELKRFPSNEAGPAAFMSEGAFGKRDLSPDGRRFVDVYTVGGPGSGLHEAVLFGLENGKGVFANRKRGFPHYVTFARDGSLALVVDHECLLLKPGERQPSRKFEIVRYSLPGSSGRVAPANCVAVSAGAKRVAVAADGVVHVYDTAAGKLLYQSPRAWDGEAPRRVTLASLAFSDAADDDRLLLVEDFTETGEPSRKALPSTTQVRLFDVGKKQEVSRKVLTKPAAGGRTVLSCDYARAYFSPKGAPRVFFVERTVTDGAPRLLCKLIDGGSGRVLHECEGRSARYLMSPDGRYVARISSKGSARTAEVWRLDDL